MRYDMRAPDLGPGSASAAELYEAAVDQCRWADEHGFDAVYLAEHHGAEDSFCPSPLILAGAIAAGTARIKIHFYALCITMHQPLRLAEDLAVLDLIAGAGRVLITAGIGYLPSEFEMFGIEYARRADLYERNLDVLRKSWNEDEFLFEGRTVRVTPKPATPGGPTIYIGGNGKPSARRAARLDLGYRPASKELYEFYEQECARLGRTAPEPFPAHGPSFVFITEDPEKSLHQLAPHLVHASNSYAKWGAERGSGTTQGPWQEREGIDALRSDANLWVVTPEEAVRRCRALSTDYELRLHPLLGGLPPALSWRSLELLADRVLPRLTTTAK